MKSLLRLSGRWTAIRLRKNGLTAAAISSEKDAEELLETLPTLLQCKLFRGNVSRLIFLCFMCWGSAVLGIALKKIFGENSYEQSVWVCVCVSEWVKNVRRPLWLECVWNSVIFKQKGVHLLLPIRSLGVCRSRDRETRWFVVFPMQNHGLERPGAGSDKNISLLHLFKLEEKMNFVGWLKKLRGRVIIKKWSLTFFFLY